MTTTKPPPKQAYSVREVSRDTYRAILADEWPSPAGVTDFGIDSPEHLGALQYELRTGRVTLEQFDDALGWGPALTKLIGEDNPYRGVTFKTGWDELMVPIREWATMSRAFTARPTVRDAGGFGGCHATGNHRRVTQARRRRLGRRRQGGERGGVEERRRDCLELSNRERLRCCRWNAV